jgi:hypothetical protein
VRLRPLICACAASAALAVPAQAHDAGAGASASPGTALGSCDMSVALVRESAHRLRRLVPARYRLGRSLYSLGIPAFGLVVLWAFDCDAIEVPGGPPQRATVSLAGIQVETPERPSSIGTIANMFDVYAVAAQTDNASVAAWLRDGGMPARVAPGTRMERSRHVRVRAPGSHSLRLTPLHPDPIGVHRHTNAFWHDRGARSARLGLDIPQARDVTCIQLLTICGSIEASPGSPATALLGAVRRPIDLVFDHVGLTASTLTLATQGGRP